MHPPASTYVTATEEHATTTDAFNRVSGLSVKHLFQETEKTRGHPAETYLFIVDQMLGAGLVEVNGSVGSAYVSVSIGAIAQ